MLMSVPQILKDSLRHINEANENMIQRNGQGGDREIFHGHFNDVFDEINGIPMHQMLAWISQCGWDIHAVTTNSNPIEFCYVLRRKCD